MRERRTAGQPAADSQYETDCLGDVTDVHDLIPRTSDKDAEAYSPTEGGTVPKTRRREKRELFFLSILSTLPELATRDLFSTSRSDRQRRQYEMATRNTISHEEERGPLLFLVTSCDSRDLALPTEEPLPRRDAANNEKYLATPSIFRATFF